VSSPYTFHVMPTDLVESLVEKICIKLSELFVIYYVKGPLYHQVVKGLNH